MTNDTSGSLLDGYLSEAELLKEFGLKSVRNDTAMATTAYRPAVHNHFA